MPYTVKHTNSLEGDTRTAEFLKLNPQHNIPVIKDGDFVMNESRAIMTYLANKYGGDDCKWYPSDLKTRTRVNQRLYFDMGSLYKAFVTISVSDN